MANHGRVYTKQEITSEQLKKDLQEINKKFLAGLFEIQNNDKLFLIKKEDFSDRGIQLWIEDECEYGYYSDPEDASTYVEYEEPKLICKNSVIGFRHMHGIDIFWWLEGVFRENLAKKYNALVGDDAYDERYPSKSEDYETFYKFIESDDFNKREWEIYRYENHLNHDFTNEQMMENLYKEINTIKRKEKLNRII